MQPTPLLLRDRIRVYVGMRDADGRSSVGWVDVRRDEPTIVLGTSERPALGPGASGTFDEFGVVPSAVARDGDTIRLYYAGYQRPPDVRFRVFGGVAWGADDGETFQRRDPSPVLEPVPGESDFRVAHAVLPGSPWRIWYGAGESWQRGEEKTLPVYDVRYVESADGLHFPDPGEVVVSPVPPEHRIGRPQIICAVDGYLMLYGRGSEAQPYRFGLARSPDGRHWRRDDGDVGIELAPEGWDSQMMAYPGVIEVDERILVFYNGNDYGRRGFGCAELTLVER